MKEFYYRYGDVETNTPFLVPPPLDNINNWIEDFKKLDLEDYKVYLGGKCCIERHNTGDVDICLTGPIHSYTRLYNILHTGVDLGLNKHNILIDIKHYDNLDFFKYPRLFGFKRLHIVTELAGKEVKIIDGKTLLDRTLKTYIPETGWIPKNISCNLTHFPLDKQITDGRIYDPVRIH